MNTYSVKKETPYVPFLPGFVFHSVDHETKSWVYIKETDAQELYSCVQGQISMDSGMGTAIYTLASNENGPKDWLEVGTWNGLGSTLCILNGFSKRNQEELRLASFELDPVMYGAAQQNLKNHQAISCITFIHNKLSNSTSTATEFPKVASFSEEDQKSDHFMIHYDRERGLYESATGYSPSFSPEAIVLDGGEYSGYFDWAHLDKSRLLWIFLDDTNIYKNKRVLNELLADPRWACIHKSDERNGWAFFGRGQV